MMPSSSEPLASSPITRIPYDALREIFIHCLPRYPLDQAQPNKTSAPILLCHICSSWRMVALSSPVLWSHLCFFLTIRSKDSKLKTSEIEFLRWWKKNHGLIPPFLSLKMWREDAHVINQKLSGDYGTYEMPFLLEYITSAQYLELDPLFWDIIRKRIKAGKQIEFPNLHTLEKSDSDQNYPFHSVQAIVAPHVFPTLRRLCMVDNFLDIDVDYKTPFPLHWSALTHITIYQSSMTLEFLYTLIRAVPNLQWAFIDISELYDYEVYPSEILPCNLPHLATLKVNFDGTPEFEDVAKTPFHLLLTNFRTPSLRTLSLSWTIPDEGLGDDSATINELHAVLEALPTVRTLGLAGDFLSFDKRGSGTMTLGGRGQAQPIWKHAKQLTEIQLDLPLTHGKRRPDAEEALDTFVRNIFFCNNSWLDLANSACPIRTVSLMDDDQPVGFNTEAFTMSCIQKQAEKVPNVVFQLTSQPARFDVVDAWNDWGVGI